MMYIRILRNRRCFSVLSQ